MRELGRGWAERPLSLAFLQPSPESLCVVIFVFCRLHCHGRIPLSTPLLHRQIFSYIYIFQLLFAPRMYKVPLKILRAFYTLEVGKGIGDVPCRSAALNIGPFFFPQTHTFFFFSFEGASNREAHSFQSSINSPQTWLSPSVRHEVSFALRTY